MPPLGFSFQVSLTDFRILQARLTCAFSKLIELDQQFYTFSSFSSSLYPQTATLITLADRLYCILVPLDWDHPLHCIKTILCLCMTMHCCSQFAVEMVSMCVHQKLSLQSFGPAIST